MKVVILQPSYIPWRGYFDQICRADLFIFYDDVQYDKRGWRNRNQIKTPKGKQWLTIPVHSHGAQTENIPINQIRIVWDNPWSENHLKALQHSYAKAPHFDPYYLCLRTFINAATNSWQISRSISQLPWRMNWAILIRVLCVPLKSQGSMGKRRIDSFKSCRLLEEPTI